MFFAVTGHSTKQTTLLYDPCLPVTADLLLVHGLKCELGL